MQNRLLGRAGSFLFVAAGVALASACGGSTFVFTGEPDGSSGGSGTTGGGATGDVSTGGSGSSTAADDAGGSGGAVSTTGMSSGTSDTGATAGGTTGSMCDTGTITLKLVPADGSNPAAFCQDACDATGWVSITDPSGAVMRLSRPCGTASCSQCEARVCPAIACVAPQPLTREGMSFTWDGVTYEGSTCQGAAGMLSCDRARCAVAGHYTATLCADVAQKGGGGGPGSGTATCILSDSKVCAKVEFDLPASGQIVTGTVSPP